MNTDNTYDKYADDRRIDDFMRGRMTADAERHFMAKLKADRTLRERAVAAARLALAMKAVGSERDRIVIEALLSASRDDIADIARRATDAADKDRAANGPTHTAEINTAAIRRRFLRIASVAVVALSLCLPAKQYLNYRAVTRLADRYAPIFSHSDFVRGGAATDAERELAQLYANVLNGHELAATTERLAVLWQVAQSGVYNDYADSRDEIGWQLAIAWLKQNRKDKAADILTALMQRAQDKSALKAEAERLLHDIEQLQPQNSTPCSNE